MASEHRTSPTLPGEAEARPSPAKLKVETLDINSNRIETISDLGTSGPCTEAVLSKDVKDEEDRFFLEQKEKEATAQKENVETFESLNKKEREEQYKRLKFLLDKSNLYTSYVKNRMERQAAADNKMKIRSQKKKEKKETPAQEKRTGLRETTSTKGKRKASPPKESNPKKRRRVEKEEKENDIEEIEEMEPSAEDESIEAQDDHPVLFTGGTLRKYQIEGYKWLQCLYENGINCILADEMGLGKTIQCIAAIAGLCAHDVPGPFLVVGPLSTVPNWVCEFQRFAPKLGVILYHGTKQERSLLRRKMFKKKEVLPGKFVRPVVVTSYEVAMNDRPYLQSMGWSYLIVDEGHRIKNFSCRLIKELKLITSSHRLLLTGTPLQNNLAELWSLLNFILPEIFDSLGSFQMWFDASNLKSDSSHEAIIEEERQNNVLSMLHQILCPFLLRRVKADVELNLPPKRELLVYAPLTESQATFYRGAIDDTIEAMVKKKEEKKEKVEETLKGRGFRRKSNVDYSKMFAGEIDDEKTEDDIVSWCNSFVDDGPKTAVKQKSVSQSTTEVHLQIVNKMMLLRKICNHPYLIEYPLTKDGEYKVNENLVSCCGKLKLFDQMVSELRKRGHKIIVFSQMTSVLDILQDYCNLRMLEFSRLDGSMKVDDRKVEIEKFNTDPDVGIFLLSTRAGGLGINLVAADTCIIYDSDWNPQADLQAQDRCHRIGQTKPVLIFRLVTAKTIDQEIVERAAAKRKLEKMIIIKGRFKSGLKDFETKLSKMNTEELRELLTSTDHDDQLEVSHSNQVLSQKDLARLLDRSSLMEMWKEARSEGGKPSTATSSTSDGVEGVFKVLEEEISGAAEMGTVRS